MISTAIRLNSISEYYFSTKLREVRQMMTQGKPVMNMGIGSPDLAPHKNVLDALCSAMADHGAHQYQSYNGLPELRQAMAHFYQQQFGVSVNPDNEILPLMGSKEGIMHLSMAFLNPGDQALIPDPGYPTYNSVTKLVGATPLYYQLDAGRDWEPDWEALEASDLSKVKLLWINYPHMPTGTKGSIELLEKWVAFALKHHILLVNDNPYSFVLNDKPISVLQIEGAKEIAVELNSLSKTFNLAGWRVGMLLGNPEVLQAVLTVKSNFDSGMFYGIQKGAVAALQSGADGFAAMNHVYAERRELVFKLAHLLNCTFNSNAAGLFVWAKLPQDSIAADKFVDKILEEKYLFIAPGTIFGSQGVGYIRFSLCVDAAQIQQAIDRF